jgi:thioredoxin 1
MSESVRATSDTNFEKDVLQAKGPVLVDFWASWCQPCKMISPIVDEIAKEYAGRLHVFKVNVDENTETPAKFKIRGIPTLLVFVDGNVAATQVGLLSKAQLKAFLDEHI